MELASNQYPAAGRIRIPENRRHLVPAQDHI